MESCAVAPEQFKVAVQDLIEQDSRLEGHGIAEEIPDFRYS
jgi:hypothetical protein